LRVCRHWWQRLHIFAGILIFSAIVLPWYLAVGYATNGLFPKVFFLYENLARFAGHTNLAHTTWYHYFWVLLYGFFPWVFFLVPGLRLAFSLNHQAKDPLLSVRDHSEDPLAKLNSDRQQTLRFLACWSITTFLFFSFSKTQLDTYLLPAIAPLSIIVATYFEQMLTKMCSSRSIFKLACLFGTTVLVSTIGCQIGIRLLDKNGQEDLRFLCQDLRDCHDHIAIFQTFKPSIMFYSRKPIDSFFHTSQLVPLTSSEKNTSGLPCRQLIIAHDRTLPELQAVPNIALKLFERRGSWSIWEATKTKLEKVQSLEALFKNKQSFEHAVSGLSDWGPLTVPYAGGDPNWWHQLRP
jgi:hypothetical protein